LDETNPIFDHPTCRLLGIAVAEEEQMIAWGEQALAALLHDHTTQHRCQDWERHVQAYLQQAGGISGRLAIPPGLVLPTPRAHAPFVPSFEPQRDDRSNERHNFASRYQSVYNDPVVVPYHACGRALPPAPLAGRASRAPDPLQMMLDAG
jgi:hypothetical protein